MITVKEHMVYMDNSYTLHFYLVVPSSFQYDYYDSKYTVVTRGKTKQCCLYYNKPLDTNRGIEQQCNYELDMMRISILKRKAFLLELQAELLEQTHKIPDDLF